MKTAASTPPATPTPPLKDIPAFIKTQKESLSRRALGDRVVLALGQAIGGDSSSVTHSDLNKLFKIVSAGLGPQTAVNIIKKLEVHLGWRKPTLAIFDHAFHFIGGAQKYGLTVADILQQRFDITLIATKPVEKRDFLEWYGLDLSSCGIKVVEIPFFNRFSPIHLDPSRVSLRTGNPFHRISFESGRYDLFLNNSMMEMVYPLSPLSLMICHFPERRPDTYFYSDQYDYVIYNSRYTARWIEKRWKFTPHKHIYPPVDMEIFESGDKKENLILSVARFEEGGTKKQLELAAAFVKLQRQAPEASRSWKLVLAGGSNPDNPFLSQLEEFLADVGAHNIEVKTNIPEEELKDLYKKAKIFWHLCGLNQDDPAKVEHFGMTIVEALQNRLVPIVFDGGGQREIVRQGVSGYRVASPAALIRHTLELMTDPKKLTVLSNGAYQRSLDFSMEAFTGRVEEFFTEIMDRHFLTLSEPS